MHKIKLFFFGVLAACGSLLVEMAIAIPFPREMAFLFQELTFLLVVFIIIEELFKFFIIRKAASSFRIPGDFFVGAYLVGLGFSITEIFLAGLGAGLQEKLPWLPLLGIFIVHTTTCILWGLGIFYKKRGVKNSFFLALASTFFLHFFYNLIIIYASSPIFITPYLLAACALVFVFVRKTFFSR